MWNLLGLGEGKFVDGVRVTRQDGRQPVYDKTLQDLYLKNLVYTFEDSSPSQFVQMITIALTLTKFIARSTLVRYACIWEKAKTVDLSGTIEV